MNDGAAAVVIASREYSEKNELKPLARVVGYAQAAVEPEIPLRRAGACDSEAAREDWLDVRGCRSIELNEAFAAQVLADGYALADQGWDWSKVNVNGGAIALGHPLGPAARACLRRCVCPQGPRLEEGDCIAVPGRR